MKRVMIILAFVLLLNQNVTMASEYYDDEIEIKLNHGWGIVMSDVVKHLEILPGSPAEIFVENGREYVIAKGYGDITVLIHTEKRSEPYRYLLHCRSEAEKNRIANIVTPLPPVDQNLINQAYYEHNYYGSTITGNQIAQAEEIAKSIADSIRNNPAYKNDLQRVKAVAREVASRSAKHLSLYGSDENKYYRSPYGVLVTGNFTCAGATRTVGRILDYMGYKWTHVNENEWLHQWCVLEMDGQIGYADANVIPEGKVGYGQYWDGLSQVRRALEAQGN
jgi:hypothetical protein